MRYDHKYNWKFGDGSCARIVIGNTTYGLFYDSKSRLRHISIFIPNKTPPSITLCNDRFVNFSPTAYKENICPACLTSLRKEIDTANLTEITDAFSAYAGNPSDIVVELCAQHALQFIDKYSVDIYGLIEDRKLDLEELFKHAAWKQNCTIGSYELDGKSVTIYLERAERYGIEAWRWSDSNDHHGFVVLEKEWADRFAKRLCKND